MIEAADKKREMILEQALLRFAHFGINKTTMNDIAEDLSISKPSLYYYFPDKVRLVFAVAGRVFDEFFARLEKIIEQAESVKTALFQTIELRREFLQKYYMLHIGDIPGEQILNNEDFRKLLDETRSREITVIERLFERGVENKEFVPISCKPTAELYLETIIGLSMYVMARNTKQLIPELKGLDDILNRQKSLTEIFLNGLKVNEHTNDFYKR